LDYKEYVSSTEVSRKNGIKKLEIMDCRKRYCVEEWTIEAKRIGRGLENRGQVNIEEAGK
jgi:hypothetical protein